MVMVVMMVDMQAGRHTSCCTSVLYSISATSRVGIKLSVKHVNYTTSQSQLLWLKPG